MRQSNLGGWSKGDSWHWELLCWKQWGCGFQTKPISILPVNSSLPPSTLVLPRPTWLVLSSPLGKTLLFHYPISNSQGLWGPILSQFAFSSLVFRVTSPPPCMYLLVCFPKCKHFYISHLLNLNPSFTTYCPVNLGKLLHVSVSQFPYFQDKSFRSIYFMELLKN